jgi:hypothetical protein
MTVPGTYTDTLRAMGCFLSQIGATDIAIIEEPHDLGVVWQGPDGAQRARRFGEGDLWTLRASARLFRGTGAPGFLTSLGRLASQRPSRARQPALPLGERLRTLGAVVDRLQMTGLAIAETRDGFRMSGLQQGRRFTLTFPTIDLMAQANRGLHRRGASTMSSPKARPH